jgi:hypothetical protein
MILILMNMHVARDQHSRFEIRGKLSFKQDPSSRVTYLKSTNLTGETSDERASKLTEARSAVGLRISTS